MDIESHELPLFYPLNSETQAFIMNKPCQAEGSFAFSMEDNANNSLKLFGNSIILTLPNKACFHLQLTFSIKFQILYAVQKDVNSTQLGIRLYDQNNINLWLYSRKTVVEEWSYHLSKLINQKGFHEMFKPIKKLGKGNFATVYQAERVTDKQRFAVKAFSKQNSYSAKNGKESLINELNIMRQLNFKPHPNVLKLEAVYQSDNSIYVVLELLTGQTLFQKIHDRKGIFSKEEIKQLMTGLLSGLHHMHSHRIMHRDLKPENIMLRGDTCEPVIVDFGLSTNADLKEYLFFRCGTPGYVAPQIIQLVQCSHVQPACDVFSLGAIFHILLVRRPLFEGTKYDEVYKNNKEFKIKIQGEGYKLAELASLDLLKQMLHLAPMRRIAPLKALEHNYFTGTDNMELESITEVKLGSPVLTEATVSKDKKKKRNFLFF